MGETTAGAVDPQDALENVESVIDDCFHAEWQRGGGFTEFDRVWKAAWRLSSGGRMPRSRLLLAAHDAFAESPPSDEVIRGAAALELLHLGFFLHDDVIDRALVRRGETNLIARMRDEARDRGIAEEEALHYGRSCAVLVGDLLIASAHRLVGELDVSSERRRMMLGVLGEAASAAAAGEHSGALTRLLTDADEDTILRTLEQRSTQHSFGAPLRMGAVLGGADAGTAVALDVIGKTIGVAVQARDDVAGVFGGQDRADGSALSDLRDGKLTLLIVYARRDPAWPHVAHLFGRPDLRERDAERLREVIIGSGALDRVEYAITSLADAARSSLRRASLPLPLVERLEDTIAQTTVRSR